LGFRVQGLGVRVEGLGVRVEGVYLRVVLVVHGGVRRGGGGIPGLGFRV